MSPKLCTALRGPNYILSYKVVLKIASVSFHTSTYKAFRFRVR
jgi:hypothetical protein